MGRYVETSEGYIVWKYRGDSSLGRLYRDFGVGEDYVASYDADGWELDEEITLDRDAIVRIEAILDRFSHWKYDAKNSEFWEMTHRIVELFHERNVDKLELGGEGIFRSKWIDKQIETLEARSLEDQFRWINEVRKRKAESWTLFVLSYLLPIEFKPPINESMITRARQIDDAMAAKAWDDLVKLVAAVEPKIPVVYAIENLAVRKIFKPGPVRTRRSKI